MSETTNTCSEQEGKPQPAEKQEHGAECQCPECTCSACECFRQYARQHPEAVALWCFGIGFVLGWKMRPHGSG